MENETGKVQVISAELTYPLRHRILRPTQKPEDCEYPLDQAPSSFHVGYVIADRVVGVGSIFQESPEGDVTSSSWRIRGMAVDENVRGRGIGGQVLTALIAYAMEQSAEGEIWCNGRTSVQAFYERNGFQQIGEVFDLPPIGPHVVLKRTYHN